MSIRDLQASFTDDASGTPLDISAYTVANGAYLAPNSIDTAPLGAYLTALTAADTQLSPNLNTYRDMGGGARLWLVVDYVAAVTSGGSATLDVALITSASSSLGTATTMIDFGAVAKATLVKGYRQIQPLPRSAAWLRYLGLQITVGTADLTAGKIIAWLATDIDAVNLGAASGYSIK